MSAASAVSSRCFARTQKLLSKLSETCRLFKRYSHSGGIVTISGGASVTISEEPSGAMFTKISLWLSCTALVMFHVDVTSSAHCQLISTIITPLEGVPRLMLTIQKQASTTAATLIRQIGTYTSSKLNKAAYMSLVSACNAFGHFA